VYRLKEINVEIAEGIFEETVQNPMFANFRTEGVRDRARIKFIRRFKGLDGTEGKLREEKRSEMCIRRKSIYVCQHRLMRSQPCCCTGAKNGVEDKRSIGCGQVT
jgi:hypothetical protein